ncbi:hypothetical protein P879_07245 [Paragonimus westermani]|uniref:RIIa domain-containing protein n=1 Tax=Paragonimus westermani TaxID=34504 RepID=A0A8T0DIQ4_9TREM|nr:hypothetical protein P879_07245 [Paragonimus westermani]
MVDEHSRLSRDLLILMDRFYNAAMKENPRDIIGFAVNYFNALNTNEKKSDIFDLTSYHISAIHPSIRNLATSTHTEGPDLIGSRPHVFKTASAPHEWKAPMLRTASATSCSNASDPQIFVTVSDHFKESDSHFSAAYGDVPEVFTEDCEERFAPGGQRSNLLAVGGEHTSSCALSNSRRQSGKCFLVMHTYIW